MPNRFEVELYQANRLTYLAVQFVDEGRYSKIPEPLRNYIYLDAIAHGTDRDSLA